MLRVPRFIARSFDERNISSEKIIIKTNALLYLIGVFSLCEKAFIFTERSPFFYRLFKQTDGDSTNKDGVVFVESSSLNKVPFTSLYNFTLLHWKTRNTRLSMSSIRLKMGDSSLLIIEYGSQKVPYRHDKHLSLKGLTRKTNLFVKIHMI